MTKNLATTLFVYLFICLIFYKYNKNWLIIFFHLTTLNWDLGNFSALCQNIYIAIPHSITLNCYTDDNLQIHFIQQETIDALHSSKHAYQSVWHKPLKTRDVTSLKCSGIPVVSSMLWYSFQIERQGFVTHISFR